jgi:hypothetical protein
MRRLLFLLTLAFAVGLPAAAFADGVEIRFGAYFPTTGAKTASDCASECNIFQDTEELFGASKSGWTAPFGGVEYSRRVSPNIEVGLHVDGFGRKRETAYRDYTWDDRADITQTLQVSAVPIGVSLRMFPAGTGAAVSPYLTVGADVVIWNYRERGDFIDFDTPGLDINYDEFSASGAAPGAHVAAGVRLPFSYDFSLTAEVRYLFVKKVDMGGDFQPYSIDLSGPSATLGFHLRF